MLDARNNLIDQLSEFGDIHVDDNFDGSVKITMGGLTIIDGKRATFLLPARILTHTTQSTRKTAQLC